MHNIHITEKRKQIKDGGFRIRINEIGLGEKNPYLNKLLTSYICIIDYRCDTLGHAAAKKPNLFANLFDLCKAYQSRLALFLLNRLFRFPSGMIPLSCSIHITA